MAVVNRNTTQKSQEVVQGTNENRVVVVHEIPRGGGLKTGVGRLTSKKSDVEDYRGNVRREAAPVVAVACEGK